MPGFVDVSGWTSEDVRRLGHEDDDIDFGPTPGRRNTVLQVGYSASDVWAAACAAQRINDGYYKEEQWMPNATPPYISKRRNRDLMMEFLASPTDLTTDDVEAGEQCRKYLEQDLVFRAVKGQLTDFDRSVQKVLAVKDRFYTVGNRYELAVVASLPNSMARSQARQAMNDRIQSARGGLFGTVGEKVTVNVEVLSAQYRQEYNIFWIRAITDQDQPVLFSSKTKYDANTWLTIRGKVKAHRDNLTQLNYVKVL
jgi:hypothetical protein